jgi:hypothetical protein
MKGTFFSADFVVDKNDNPRLVEINTDTGAVSSQMDAFDWTDFINILQTNDLNQVDVVYKVDAQQPIVTHLSQSLAEHASFITTFNAIVVPESSIFPTSPSETGNNFILRMAYDETAILDSEYAKGTLGLLKLFADAGDSGSVVGFYHSSSVYGEYDTIDKSFVNGDTYPDVVSKTTIELHQPHKFFKLGHSTDTAETRYNDFIAISGSSDYVLEEYHINQSQKDNGVVTSLRSFQIVYGSNLDLCVVAEYEIEAVLDLPTSINYDDAEIANLIDKKHYYEFASNHIKNINEGLLGDELVVDVDGNAVAIEDLVIGNNYQSYHIEGLPQTDDYDILDAYSIDGNTLPSGSFLTSSFCVSVSTQPTYANDMTKITFENGSDIVVGGQTRLLTYHSTTDKIQFIRASELDTNYAIFNNSGSLGLNNITAIDIVIFDEEQSVYSPSMDPVDNFILESGNFVSFFITHNLGSCFLADTMVTMADGTTKAIQFVEVGDMVLSFTEPSAKLVENKVIEIKNPQHDDIVKYTLENGTIIYSTEDHPFYINGNNLCSYAPDLTNARYDIGRNVDKIEIGNYMMDKDGNTIKIVGIEQTPANSVQTYIITVENNHNFFANNILVHNK